MIKKLKSFILSDQNFLLIVVILLILLAFRIGSLSTEAENRSSTANQTTKPIELVSGSSVSDDSLTITETETTAESVVASQNGLRYYPLNCEAYKRINKENRIYFVNEERARAGGYSRSQVCY